MIGFKSLVLIIERDALAIDGMVIDKQIKLSRRKLVFII